MASSDSNLRAAIDRWERARERDREATAQLQRDQALEALLEEDDNDELDEELSNLTIDGLSTKDRETLEKMLDALDARPNSTRSELEFAATELHQQLAGKSVLVTAKQ
jgi:hypothetical protein